MSKSKIEWTDATWNPVAGCKMVHGGCENCYALVMSARLQAMGQPKYKGVTEMVVVMADGGTEWRADWETFPKNRRQGKPRWSRVFRPWPEHLSKPLDWTKGRSVFVNSMSDLFGEGVPFEFVAAVFAVMAATPRHKYVILTKRPERALEWFEWVDRRVRQLHDLRRGRGSDIARAVVLVNEPIDFWPADEKVNQMAQYLEGRGAPWPLPNVAIGVSISDQASADKFLPLLAKIPARWRIVSAEPLLGQVDMSKWIHAKSSNNCAGFGRCRVAWCGREECANFGLRPSFIDQVIIGAESGKGARPCELKWIKGLALQVINAQVPLFIKQADVCAKCEGDPDTKNGVPNLARGAVVQWGCWSPNACRNGQTGKLRKGCPAIYIPGHGTRNWAQFPVGWGS